MAAVLVACFSLSLVLTQGQSNPFSYSSNGADWTGVCSSAKEQSPIDLSSYDEVDSSDVGYTPLEVAFAPITTFQWQHEWRHYEFAGSHGNMKMNNITMECTEFHFHAPSDHHLHGTQYPLELHIGFLMPGAATYAGLAVFFEEGAEHPGLTPLIVANPTVADLSLFFPSTKIDDYYSYHGSFTNPPCTEILQWYVSGQVLQASSAQIEFFRARWEKDPSFASGKGNNRTPQPLNGRKVIHYSDFAFLLAPAFGLLALLS